MAETKAVKEIIDGRARSAHNARPISLIKNVALLEQWGSRVPYVQCTAYAGLFRNFCIEKLLY